MTRERVGETDTHQMRAQAGALKRTLHVRNTLVMFF